MMKEDMANEKFDCGLLSTKGNICGRFTRLNVCVCVDLSIEKYTETY